MISRRALLTSALWTAALLCSSPAGATPVMIPATEAASAPRTDVGSGMCSNAIHMGNSAPPFFTVDQNGVMQASQLLDQTLLNGTQPTVVTDVARAQAYQTINFRDESNDSVGDFTSPNYPDIWFPFTPMGAPTGNDENFAVRIRGYLNITSPGTQTFALRGDDLAQLSIGVDEIQVMTSVNAVNGALTRQVNFAAAGLYPFEILHFYNDSQAILEMSHIQGVFPEQNNNFLNLAQTPYQLWGTSPTDLYSAVVGTGDCQECDPTAACPSANFCRDSLCQPCILTTECGPSCVACTGATPICDVPDGDPNLAHCVQCVTNVDCPGGMCNQTTGMCVYPDMRPPADLRPYPDLAPPPMCTSDKQCPLGEYCGANGKCQSCPTGEEAVARPDGGGSEPPRCIDVGYRGSWACNAAPSGASGATGGTGGPGGAGLVLLALGALGLALRRRRAATVGAAALLCLAGAEQAHAQTATAAAPTTVNLQTYQPAIGPDPFLSVDGSRGPGKTTFFINVLGDYALHPLRYVDLTTGQVLSETVPNLLTIHLMPGIGIGHWFSFGLDLPVIAYQQFGTETPAFPTAPSSYGLGDLRLAAKIRIIDNDFRGFGLAFVGQVTVPLNVGNDTLTNNLHSSGNGSSTNVGIQPRLVFDYHWRGGAEVGLNLGFLAYTNGDLQGIPGTVLVSHQLTYGLGGYLPLTDIFGLFAELYGSAGVKQLSGGQTYAPLEAMIGAKLASASGLTANLGIGTGLISDVGAPQVRVVLSLGWLPSYSDPDIDKDGVLNKDDRCPTIPGPKENDGCPWPDTDGDGIIDPEDRCPTVPGPRENHGCPDVDTDKDGTVDRLDRCPTIPGPKENHGCPWPDTDKDGVIDPEDKCPTIPGPKENHGCPWPDTDGDGIIDPEDKCPLVPGPRENQGCPDVDTDGDGIVDRLDKCPLVPGVPPTGCPERKFIVVTQDKIELKQKIFFATNKSKIMPASFDLLNEVVSVLKERPTMMLRIEGHTDSRGTIELNTRLSQARADSVRDYLVQAGIGSERLTTQGFGPSRPIGDNSTPEGQDKNRRTEFYITQQ